MKTHLLSLSLVLVAACAGSTASKAPASAPAAPIAAPQPEMKSVGGYATQDVSTQDAQTEAAHAIDLLRTKNHDPSIALSAIRAFGTQVVNGMNERFELAVATSAGPHDVTVVMYVTGDPDHLQRELTSVAGL